MNNFEKNKTKKHLKIFHNIIFIAICIKSKIYFFLEVEAAAIFIPLL